jgi:hypothetical protein
VRFTLAELPDQHWGWSAAEHYPYGISERMMLEPLGRVGV